MQCSLADPQAFAKPPQTGLPFRQCSTPRGAGMMLLALTLAAFACFALVFLIKQRQFNQPSIRLPYQLKRPFFEPAERAQLELLEQAVGEQYLILAKVRLADVVEVTAVPRRGHWYHAVNRISAARFDYLLCDRQSLEPVCAVEIQDATDANAPLDEICQVIGLPLVRLTPQYAQSFDRLRTAIETAVAD